MLDQLAAQMSHRLTLLRRDLHAHPELAFQEHETARKIAAFLRALGARVTTGVGGTGVVGILEGTAPGPVVGLRADMDALPIMECGERPHASRTPGVMHACGHDLHVAIALGVAEALTRLPGGFAGTVKFIFQPAEETMGGALAMIDAGVLESPRVEAMLGFHNSPQYPLGSILYMHGASMAAIAAFDLELFGKSAHGAQPHAGVDAIVAAAHVVSLLQTVVSRETPPLESAVLTIGRIEGGRARNVLAHSVRLEGAARYLDADRGRAIEQAVRRLVQGACAALAVRHELGWREQAPPVVSDGALLGRVVDAVRAELGEAAVQPLPVPSLGSEDFAHFCARVRCVHLRLGTGPPHGPAVAQLHHADYDANDDAIKPGVRALGAALLALLHR